MIVAALITYISILINPALPAPPPWPRPLSWVPCVSPVEPLFLPFDLWSGEQTARWRVGARRAAVWRRRSGGARAESGMIGTIWTTFGAAAGFLAPDAFSRSLLRERSGAQPNPQKWLSHVTAANTADAKANS